MKTAPVSVVTLPDSHWSGYKFQTRWTVRGADGKAVRKFSFFHSKREADACAAEKRRDLTAHGAEHSTVTTAERAALIRFREWRKLTPDAPDLSAVIEAAIAAHGAAQSTITVSEAVRQRLDDAERRGLSVRHQTDLKHRLGRFAAAFGERPLSAVTVEELGHWLHGMGVAPETFKNYARVIGSAFSLAVDRGHVALNPVAKLKAPKAAHSAPAILTPAQGRALIAAAAPALLPLLVLQSFCGVRRAEAERLTWGDLRLDGPEPFVEMHSGITKTNRRRNPPIPENAAAWLRAHRGLPGAGLGISPDVYRRHLEAAAAAAGIDWHANVLRHSYGTYRLAVTKNAAQVAEEMGNSPAMIRAHYQNTCSPEAAREWFTIAPDAAPAAVLPFVRTA
jgi:integrase